MKNESNDTTTMDEWRTRALRAEAIIYGFIEYTKGYLLVQDTCCPQCEYVAEDYADAEERLFEIAAETVGDDYDIGELPVPDAVRRLRSDEPLTAFDDRTISAAIPAHPHPQMREYYILIVHRRDANIERLQALANQAWKIACDASGITYTQTSMCKCDPHIENPSLRYHNQRIKHIPEELRRRVLLNAPLSKDPVIAYQLVPAPRPPDQPVDLLFSRA